MVGRECSQVDQGSMHGAARYWYNLMNYWESNYICEPLTVTNNQCHQYPAGCSATCTGESCYTYDSQVTKVLLYF